MNGAIRVVLEGVLAKWDVYLAPRVRTAIAEQIAQIMERREHALRTRIHQLEAKVRAYERR